MTILGFVACPSTRSARSGHHSMTLPRFVVCPSTRFARSGQFDSIRVEIGGGGNRVHTRVVTQGLTTHCDYIVTVFPRFSR